MTDHAAVVREKLTQFWGYHDEDAQTGLAALAALEQELEIILPPDEVCACLSETGGRTVRVYERCERCRALMESDYPERVAALEQELAEARRKMEGCPVCSQNVPGPSWRDTP